MQAGTEIAGRYVLEKRLGSGGMGEVWRGTDRRLDRPVAVKVMRDRLTDPLVARRFQREARIAARLQHPGITVVHDVGDHDGQPFIVMELLDGRDLAYMLEQTPGRRLPADEAISLVIQAAEALQAAHAGHVIHRDLKPANLFLQSNGLLKICDFGIARAANVTDSLTSVGQAVGTAWYMSPEQCEGNQVDERSDLYSLGCVLHELLTGQPPFPAGDALAIMYQHRNTPAVGPRTLRPDIPAELDTLVLNLLAKAPADRPPDASHVAAALKKVTREAQEAPRQQAGEPSRQDALRAGAGTPSQLDEDLTRTHASEPVPGKKTPRAGGPRPAGRAIARRLAIIVIGAGIAVIGLLAAILIPASTGTPQLTGGGLGLSAFVLPDGEAGIAVEGPSNSLLYYHAAPGGQWTVSQVAGDNTTFSAPSFFVRPDGEADIAVEGPSNSLLYYHATPGAQWTVGL